ncbi:MAG TPA: hypothetical protein EYQ83_00785 [Acidobacteria bacterium]|nr:hypothetical protein [Acidobacteriota bacterium]
MTRHDRQPRSFGGVGAMGNITSEQLVRRLADIDRRLRHVAGLLRPVGTSRGEVGGMLPESDGAPELPVDVLLARIGRTTATLQASPVQDAAAVLIMRTLLADVSLVTEAFRSAVTLGARRLDEVRALVEEARPTATEGPERDRISTS